MRTKSIWGNPPSRLYRFKRMLQAKFGTDGKVCVVGASDGKFVFPFLRSGFAVTAYEVDDIAVFGGEKEFPIARKDIPVQKYVPNPNHNPIYQKVPSEMRHIQGLKLRAELEHLDQRLTIRIKNFYKDPPSEKYEAIFTSCSIPYECNFDIPVADIMRALMDTVSKGGYLYMDYMLPLEDCHEWRPEHYLRRGTVKKYLSNGDWKVIHLQEMSKPIFEAAHADRPNDHFHRFGYVLAERV